MDGKVSYGCDTTDTGKGSPGREMSSSQHEQLAKCAEGRGELGAGPMYKAFEKQFDKITMKSGEKVARSADRMEHTILESNAMSPFLGAYECERRMGFWTIMLVGILFVAALIGATVPPPIRLL